MDCDCSVDYEGYEFISEAIRTARKEHRCCECGDTIRPGERYEDVAGKWECEFDVFKTCMTCLTIRQHYCPSGWAYGFLAEQLSECLGFSHLEIPEDDE